VKDVQPEGEIYRLLHTEWVLNVPICLLAVDVGDVTSFTDLALTKLKTNTSEITFVGN